MAKVWFVRRSGSEWIAPGGQPAYELPLEKLVFPLDLGPQRWLCDDRPRPEPALPPEEPLALRKVIVETSREDLAGTPFTWFRVGFYDSPYAPKEAARRIEAVKVGG